MKTVLEIANENGVSVQSVYKKINKTLLNELNGLIRKGEKGETLVTEEGARILKESYFKPISLEVERVFKDKNARNVASEELNGKKDGLNGGLKVEREVKGESVIYAVPEELLGDQRSLIDGLKVENQELKKRIAKLDEELSIERSHSREKSDQLASLAEKLTELTRNSQIMQHASSSQRILESGDPEERKSWFSIFWRGAK